MQCAVCSVYRVAGISGHCLACIVKRIGISGHCLACIVKRIARVSVYKCSHIPIATHVGYVTGHLVDLRMFIEARADDLHRRRMNARAAGTRRLRDWLVAFITQPKGFGRLRPVILRIVDRRFGGQDGLKFGYR